MLNEIKTGDLYTMSITFPLSNDVMSSVEKSFSHLKNSWVHESYTRSII